MEPVPPPSEEEEEEEEDWHRPQPGGGAAPPAPADHGKAVSACRVVVHIDLDCFYAQVEMIRNPELRDKPLGVQQKYIVVTCNYEARKRGVKKMMSVKDAKEKCPQLVLVNGEDLTPYREMSYKVTELLGEFCPLVERLGFDENFVDITEIVEKRLNQLQQSGWSGVGVSGHVYNHQAINLHDTTHVRLVIGSQIAEELRGAIYARLGLTGCAGVASNKLLSKLVSGTFKPNQQTLLLPESCQDLIRSLDHIQKVPGIGYKTTQRLEMLGVRNVCDLQVFPSEVLEKELGVSAAQRIQKLSYGEDDSPVTPSGPPQSFSDEDSFKKCSSEVEVKEKIEELLPNLLDRIRRDGRQPHTVRLTLRQFSSTNKWFHRESRQCALPPHLSQKFGKESSNIISPLVDLLMKLFRKMIDVDLPFHLTLLSVCFSNLKDLPSSKLKDTENYSAEKENCNSTSATKTRKLPEEKQSNIKKAGIPDFPFHLAPGDIDQEVFRELPEDIQKEMISENPAGIPPGDVLGGLSACFVEVVPGASRAGGSPEGHGNPGTSSSVEQPPADALNFMGRDQSSLEAGAGRSVPWVPLLGKDKEAFETACEEKTYSRQAGIIFPPHVDTKTFYELPADVQKELLAEWRSQEPASKTSTDKPPEKPKPKKGRRSTAPCLAQSNSLLRYFKPR
uniref:DNA polymerase iota n=1 Tax=Otus sunia TaxID=257818 RepID=A0A8C8E847_9STRI